MRPDHNPMFVPTRRAAAILGVPIDWLKREADAGRLPCIRVGRRRMFDPAVVARALAERAEREGVTHAE